MMTIKFYDLNNLQTLFITRVGSGAEANQVRNHLSEITGRQIDYCGSTDEVNTFSEISSWYLYYWRMKP